MATVTKHQDGGATLVLNEKELAIVLLGLREREAALYNDAAESAQKHQYLTAADYISKANNAHDLRTEITVGIGQR